MAALLVCLPLAAWAQPASPPPAGAQAATNPAVEKFYSALVFYAGFNGDAAANLTPAEPKPQSAQWAAWLTAHPEVFQPGVVGQAIETGDYTLSYDLGSNVTLEQTGSAAIWLSATQWQRRERDPGYFFALRLHAGNRQLMLARMGNPLNKECLYAHFMADKSPITVTSGSTAQWNNRDWHLLVMNWGPNWLEYSLDAGQLSRVSLSQDIAATGATTARLFVSSPRISDTFLIDEVLVLSRPLDADEVQWLYKNRGEQPLPDAKP
jgi:hypothetical protein